jgi:myo-inositol 2-dehydrogenase/D-chiro-inositol 1-dehydrogenase
MGKQPYKIGIIGLGNMGSGYLKTLAASKRWRVVIACDLNEQRLEWAKTLVPGLSATRDAGDVTGHPDLDVVGLFTLADARPALMQAALGHGKHILAEKPIAASVDTEKALLRTIEASGKIVAVNLFNRNAWYHESIQAFIKEGQIGQLAVLAISHQTPGLMPTLGHQPEGPPFHDCGMHYVDVARWYAGSEYDRWHAQGLRMWSWKDPWWVNAHGHFKNGVVFSITQGFVYGQLAETKTTRCGLDVIGTKGVVRMQHDFSTTRIEFHGQTRTEVKEGPYGGKKLDVLCERFADALDTGDASRLPSARDSVIASEVSQAMLDAATRDHPPCIGSPEEMAEILARRAARANP